MTNTPVVLRLTRRCCVLLCAGLLLCVLTAHAASAPETPASGETMGETMGEKTMGETVSGRTAAGGTAFGAPGSGVQAAGPARPASSPLMPGGEFSWWGYAQAVGSMFLVLGVLWFVLWLLRRSGRFAGIPRTGTLPRDALYLERQLSLGPRKGLMVVRFLNKRLLLGVTDQHITLLTETDPHDDAQSFQRCLADAAPDGPEARPDASRGETGSSASD